MPGAPAVFRAQACFFVSTVCERGALLTIAWWMLGWPDGGHWLAVVTGVGVACEIGAKPLTGWLGDVFAKPFLIIAMIASSLTGTAALLALSLLHVRAPMLVMAGICITSAATGALTPLRSSLMPELVAAAEVDVVVRFSAVVSAMALVSGPAVFGGLLSLSGVSGAFALQVAFLGLAAWLAFGVVRAAPDDVIRVGRNAPVAADRRGMMLRSILAFPGIRTEFCLSIVAAAVNLFIFPFFVILVPQLVRNGLGLPAWYLGLLDTAFGVGIAVGSRYLMARAAAHIGRAAVVSAGFSLLAVNLAACAVVEAPLALAGAFFVGGIGLVSINANTSMLQLRATPRVLRNRVSAVRAFYSGLGCPLGCALTYALLHAMTAVWICSVYGVAVVCLAGGVFLVPHFAALLAGKDDRIDDAYARLYPQALARF